MTANSTTDQLVQMMSIHCSLINANESKEKQDDQRVRDTID